MRRKTDFFRSGDDEKAKNMVLKMLEKHQSLADKTNAQKKKLSADAEAAAHHKTLLDHYRSLEAKQSNYIRSETSAAAYLRG